MEKYHSTASHLSVTPYPEDIGSMLARPTPSYSPILLGLVIGGLAIGTGGSLTGSSCVEFGKKARATNTLCEVDRLACHASVPDEDLLSAQEKITAIQHYFSLGVTELAQIFNVSRPTIYSWLRTEQEPQWANLNRINVIYDVTRFWQRICIRPIGRWVRVPISAGRSLVQLFSEDQMDLQAIRAALRTIASSMDNESAKGVDGKSVQRSGSQPVGQDLLAQEFGI